MKKITIILVIISIFCLVSCMGNYIPIEEYNSKLLELKEADNIINTNATEIGRLQEEVKTLNNDLTDLELGLELSKEEIGKYQDLINNLDSLLKNVYYVYGEGNGTWVGGTGFALEYENKFYLITAGHAVDGEWGIHKNLGFRDIYDNWIYPKLLNYENDYNNRNDYAVFITDKVTNGFVVDEENDSPEYILGYNNINIIKNINGTNIEGESGSPIIDNEGEIVGILATDIFNYYTKIDLVIEAIDNLE